MLGSKQQRLGTWTLPTPLAEVMQYGDSHGHIYTLDSAKTLLPYEFRHGPLSQDATTIDPAFFVEFIEYLVTHDLDRVLGLEVLEEKPSPLNDLIEIVVDGHGSVLLGQAEIKYATNYRVTGWEFAEEEGGIITYKGNQAHGAAPSGEHKLFTDGKPFTTVETLAKVLLENGLRAV